jgi:hypothetical protein
MFVFGSLAVTPHPDTAGASMLNNQQAMQVRTT